jgi:hypothetical protein
MLGGRVPPKRATGGGTSVAPGGTTPTAGGALTLTALLEDRLLDFFLSTFPATAIREVRHHPNGHLEYNLSESVSIMEICLSTREQGDFGNMVPGYLVLVNSTGVQRDFGNKVPGYLVLVNSTGVQRDFGNMVPGYLVLVNSTGVQRDFGNKVPGYQQGLYTSKGKKIHDLFRVSQAFFLKFHDTFVNCHGYSELTTTSDQQKQ